MVIVVSEVEDAAACQLLSMLKIDSDVSGIPVVAGAMRREQSEFEHDVARADSPGRALSIAMN